MPYTLKDDARGIKMWCQGVHKWQVGSENVLVSCIRFQFQQSNSKLYKPLKYNTDFTTFKYVSVYETALQVGERQNKL